MGYIIQYEPELNKKYRITGKTRSNKTVVGITGILCIILLMSFVPTVRQWLWELLIPGDAQVTTQAFSELIVQLRNGGQIPDAVTAFCQEILANA